MMIQNFETTTDPRHGAARVQLLRAEMAGLGIDGFLVPRADAHQGEYVAPHDARLAWLTGFSGSAGFAAILTDEAGIFVDGRYRLQVRDQVNTSVFTPVDWPETRLGPWLAARLSQGAVLGYDAWLHTIREIRTLTLELADQGVTLRPVDNPLDVIWADQPAPPRGPIIAYPDSHAGEASAEKRARLADDLKSAGDRAAFLTLPDSIAWLLNIRGSDIERNPVPHAFAILHDDGVVDLYCHPEKRKDIRFDDAAIRCHAPDRFTTDLARLDGPVRRDPNSCPMILHQLLQAAGVSTTDGPDPCLLPKACKNETELQGARDAQARDAVAMVEFLAWLDQAAPGGGLSEIDVVTALEEYRRATNALMDISFETIAGTGPNGAIVHYRVTRDTNRTIAEGDLLLVDSGGQYFDGTTDITRTIAIGPPTALQRRCFTRVLQGMIALSTARFPRGLAGRDLDPLARAALWRDGLDYDHGTGHGVGAYLSVHEGPARISRISDIALAPGMILSNEPGYYRAGAFGIRIENLIAVRDAPELAGADDRDMLGFETLTWVPIDRRLIDPALLGPEEIDWINTYHAGCRARPDGRLSAPAQAWLIAATEPV